MPVSRKNKKNKRSPSSQKSRERQRKKRRLKDDELNDKKYRDSLKRAVARMELPDIF
jgi:hypothetical protein